jgi:hypothetical protein
LDKFKRECEEQLKPIVTRVGEIEVKIAGLLSKIANLSTREDLLSLRYDTNAVIAEQKAAVANQGRILDHAIEVLRGDLGKVKAEGESAVEGGLKLLRTEFGEKMPTSSNQRPSRNSNR